MRFWLIVKMIYLELEERLDHGIVHRIDKDTSGLLIIAKNDKSHINISEQIKKHQVKKTYRALVRGIIKESNGTINNMCNAKRSKIYCKKIKN